MEPLENGRPTERPRALVAEDDRALADVVRMALARAGFDVSVAHDGRHALHRARAEPFAVVVSDYQMPGMNGRELLHGIRQQGASRSAGLVLCSAKSFEIDSERLREELGIAAVFYKPFSLKELVGVLQSLLPAAAGC